MSTLQQRITRSIEDALYKRLLTEGYIPDRELFADNETGFQDKQSEIRNTKGFCVGLFGHGVSHDRGIKFVPRISILGLGFVPGSVANDPVPHYELSPDEVTYQKKLGSPASSTFRFEVTLVSNKTSQDNYLETIRFTCLPPRSYIPYYDDSTERFLIAYSFVRQAPDLGTGLIQKVYLYEAIDVFEKFNDGADVIGEIGKIKTIEVDDANDQQPLIIVP